MSTLTPTTKISHSPKVLFTHIPKTFAQKKSDTYYKNYHTKNSQMSKSLSHTQKVLHEKKIQQTHKILVHNKPLTLTEKS